MNSFLSLSDLRYKVSFENKIPQLSFSLCGAGFKILTNRFFLPYAYILILPFCIYIREHQNWPEILRHQLALQVESDILRQNTKGDPRYPHQTLSNKQHCQTNFSFSFLLLFFWKKNIIKKIVSFKKNFETKIYLRTISSAQGVHPKKNPPGLSLLAAFLINWRHCFWDSKQ